MSPIPSVEPAVLPRARAARKSAAYGGRRWFHRILFIAWVGIAGFFLLWGLEYYLLPLHERPYSDLHERFKPTGTVGNRLGILGTLLLVVGVGSYMTRKRWRPLHGMGRLRDWLSFHIWCCSLGVFLVVLHSSFRVGGLVAIAFWAMIAVATSGVVGRYVYVRIPRSLSGRARALAELQEEQAAALEHLTGSADLTSEQASALTAALTPPAPGGLLRALAASLAFDLRGFWLRRRVSRILGPGAAGSDGLLRSVRDYRRISHQMALLAPFERLFRYWHTFHLPLAIVMALVVLLHIGVAIAFGYAWTP